MPPDPAVRGTSHRPQPAPPAPQPVQSLETVLALRAREEEEIGKHQRLVERVTSAVGRPRTIYVTLVFVASWIAYNLAARSWGWRTPDAPPFVWLDSLVTLASLLMTTIVLTTQNRQAMHADRRARLDLQVNLLAEQKVAKLIALVEELRRDLPNVRNRKDSIAEAMTKAVDPEAVLTALDEPRPQTPAREK
jgi:uncharacterized membrane protein